jgi:DNA repair exonuclease SbcCD nuclease subunit
VPRDLVLVHSSDIHVDLPRDRTAGGEAGLADLRSVMQTARRLAADAILLAGDTFECHRLPQALVGRTAEIMAETGIPVVILPGNHDPLTPDSVYHHPAWQLAPDVKIIGLADPLAIHFADLDLEVWGRPHLSYSDMTPLETVRPRRTRWQVAMAHGHYTPVPDRAAWPRPAWLIGDEELTATGADYVALGHWNRAASIGRGDVPAFYSGSPDYAKTVNVLSLSRGGPVEVSRVAVS